MKNTVERFSNRVENYVKYRPDYPPEVLDLFRDEMNLHEDSIVADVGAGTGISARMFLANGNRVYAVEPNAAMREAAQNYLKDFSQLEIVDGTAENTNLPDDSVDFVIAAQAFHWFDWQKTNVEFKRILRENGYAALIWNERLLEANDFLREYEAILKKFGTDYDQTRHDNIEEKVLREFFRAEFRRKTFSNVQTVDFDGLKGRVLSSSYMPSEESANFDPMVNELQRVFAKYAENGKIQILYDTNVFYTRF